MAVPAGMGPGFLAAGRTALDHCGTVGSRQLLTCGSGWRGTGRTGCSDVRVTRSNFCAGWQSRYAVPTSRSGREAPVMAGPGDEIAGSAGRGLLRASHADREQVIDTLKAAFVEGRLTKDEFDARVGQAFASRTRAELAVVTRRAWAPAGAQARAGAGPAAGEHADQSERIRDHRGNRAPGGRVDGGMARPCRQRGDHRAAHVAHRRPFRGLAGDRVGAAPVAAAAELRRAATAAVHPWRPVIPASRIGRLG
jgi:hypothetical protein